MSRVRVSFGAIAVFGALLTPLSQIAPVAAQPGPTPAMTCHESGTVSWTAPGIGSLPTTVQWQAALDLSGCSGPAVDKGLPTPVRIRSGGTEVAACDGDVSAHTGAGEIAWSDGSTSKMSQGVNVQSKSMGGGHGVFPVTITSGTYSGHLATDDDNVTPSGTCPGLTKAELTGTLSVF